MPDDVDLMIEIDDDIYFELCKLAEERKMNIEDLVTEMINQMIDHDVAN